MSDSEEHEAGTAAAAAAAEGATAVEPLTAIQVEYCPTCSFPLEYCEFSHAVKAETAAEAAAPATEAAGVPSTATTSAPAAAPSTAVSSAAGAAAEAPVPAAAAVKKEKAKMKKVNIKVVARNKTKSITTVVGLESYGVVLADAAKKLSKKLGCGCAVTKQQMNPALEELSIQGGFIYELIEAFSDWYAIPEERVTFEDKRPPQ